MPTKLHIQSAGILLLLAWSPEAGAFLPRDTVELSATVIVNAVDRPPLSGCEVSEQVQTFRKIEWWIAVGEARADPEDGGSGGRSIGIRCRDAVIERSHPDSADALENPYVAAVVIAGFKSARPRQDKDSLRIPYSDCVSQDDETGLLRSKSR